MKRPPTRVLIPVAALSALLSAGLLMVSTQIAIAAGALSLVVLLSCWAWLSSTVKATNKRMDAIFKENTAAAGKLIADVNVPCMVFHDDGRIIWRNSAMKKLHDGPSIKALPPVCAQKTKSVIFELAGASYQATTTPIVREHVGHSLWFQYWLERTEAAHYRRLFEEQMPYVALIYVDNYEELTSDVQFRRSAVITEVERLVSELAVNIDGVYRRYESGRFLLVFEAKHLPELEKSRFEILERAHKLDTGTDISVTLSIAVGAASRIRQSDEDARHAMELALGRGGDQAVVKRGGSYEFYGGRRQLETSQSRVRARLFAKALRQLIENSGDVFIMGHKNADMDCIGAALGIARCALFCNCRPHIVLDAVNPTIQHAIDNIRANPSYSGVLTTPEAARSSLKSSSLLVVVDTQRAKFSAAPDLLELTGKLVLIDHHRRSADYIDNSTLNYLEARASSTSEMVTETLQYFNESIVPTAFECSALLAGITIDTKHFAFNTGARTFEAAAYLRQHGADIGMVKLMFQDDLQTYSNRVDTVKSAVVVYPGVAMSSCKDDMENASLIAAQASDALITIRGIEASFVLSKQGENVSVSGRSLGRINVQIILERLGGGGHMTMSGAQLKGVSIEEGTELVKNAVFDYMRELENTRKD